MEVSEYACPCAPHVERVVLGTVELNLGRTGRAALRGAFILRGRIKTPYSYGIKALFTLELYVL